eukprot:scaffold316_cov352-Pavlova_lutheri.AAC.7
MSSSRFPNMPRLVLATLLAPPCMAREHKQSRVPWATFASILARWALHGCPCSSSDRHASTRDPATFELFRTELSLRFSRQPERNPAERTTHDVASIPKDTVVPGFATITFEAILGRGIHLVGLALVGH